MIIRYLFIFLSLGLEAAFGLPLFTVEMMHDFLRRGHLLQRFLYLLLFAFLLAIFYHLGFATTVWLWGLLLIGRYFISNKLGVTMSRLLTMVVFYLYIFYQAELVLNWAWLPHVIIFLFYLYKKNFRAYV
jgi:hypothetical protein